MSYHHILVAVDGSPTSDHAVAHAADLAQATGGRVRLLNVMDPIAHISGFEQPEIYSQEILPRLRKAGEAKTDTALALHSPEEQALALQLLALPDAMAAAEDKRAPNILCDYAFELAQRFSRFYAAHHILSESDAGLKAARLSLCALVLAVLTKVLDLLGIEVPERM